MLTLTRADIADAIYKEIGLPHSEASDVLESLITHVGSALIRGEAVKLAGFGKFTTQHKKERIGRNPKTGKIVPISERKVLVFKPSEKLKRRVAEGCKK